MEEYEEDGDKITVEEPRGYGSIDDYQELVSQLKEQVDDLSLTVSGEIDYNGNEFQSFRIECKNGKMKTFGSYWYNRIDLDDYEEDEIADMLDGAGISPTEEQRLEMQKRGYFLLEPDGDGFDTKKHISFEPVMEEI